MTHLLDVNCWLALAFQAHAHHPIAKSWFDATTDRMAFCRLTQMGFLRLATNPQAVGEEAVTLADAWRLYDEFLADSRIEFVDEPAVLDELWREFTNHQVYSHKIWNDAHLAAFACGAGYELITFDQGFAQYAGLTFNVLA